MLTSLNLHAKTVNYRTTPYVIGLSHSLASPVMKGPPTTSTAILSGTGILVTAESN
jgi:hypothetical protein